MVLWLLALNLVGLLVLMAGRARGVAVVLVLANGAAAAWLGPTNVFGPLSRGEIPDITSAGTWGTALLGLNVLGAVLAFLEARRGSRVAASALFAVDGIVLSVWGCALMSNPTLVDPGQQVRQIKDYRAVADAVDEARLRRTITELASFGSRVTGYPGADRAAQTIARAFREMGLEDVREERFRAAVPMDRGAALQVDGQAQPIRLACLWPNLVRTPTLPREGLRGRLIYGGYARPADFNGQEVEGSIVLLEHDCRAEWLNAFLLGARAVIFIEPDGPMRPEAEAKFLTVPADAPRFWISRREGRALANLLQSSSSSSSSSNPLASEDEESRTRTRTRTIEATLTARMDWVNAEGVNVVASLPPARSATAGLSSRALPSTVGQADRGTPTDVVVISAYYDSMSVVPAVAPGAEQACSVAALLELARTLRQYPLPRRVVFVATSGHGQALAGVRDFIRANVLPTEGGGRAPLDVAAFIALDLSSQSRRVGIFYKGCFVDQLESIQPWFSHLGQRWSQWATEASQALRWEPATAFVDCINQAFGRNWRTYMPAPMALESEMATLAGRVGIAFATTDDARLAIDSPLDTAERVNYGNLAAQVRLLCCVVPNMFNSEGPFIRKAPGNFWARLRTRAVEFNFRKDYLPNEPLPGALICLQQTQPKKSLCGVRGEPILLADEKGQAVLDGVAEQRAVGWWRANVTLGAFCLDLETGAVVYAPDLGAEGAKNYPIITRMNSLEKSSTVVCFPSRALTFYDLADQRYYVPFDTISVLDAGTNSSPTSFGYLLPRNPPWISTTETCCVVFARPGARLRILMGAGPIGKRLLLLNASPQHPLGTGFEIGAQGSTIARTPLQAARDMWLLDDERIANFRRHGLENPRVASLHAQAERQLAVADKALQERDYAAFLSGARAAWALEARIYPEVVGTANDVVWGLIYYLILVLPFSVFMERLLIGAKKVTSRVLGTTAVFVVVFLLLAVFHPAFSVSISPLMVLLAFIVLTLSVVVLTLVVRRFEELMAARRAAASGVHSADVSRLSAALTAFVLGLGNLRKRPVRTSLTAATLILLAFSLLSLTAVVQYLQQTVIPFPHVDARYEGLLLRGRQWQPISVIALDVLRNEFGKQGAVVPRAWYYSDRTGERSAVPVTGGPGHKTIYVTALLGLTPAETGVTRPQEALLAGRWLEQGKMEALLPDSMAKSLGFEPVGKALGATITCFGSSFKVVGLLNAKKVPGITDLDGEPITPVDNVLMAQRRQQQGPPDPNEFEEYIHLVADTTAVVPYEFLIGVSGSLRSIALRVTKTAEVSTLLHDLMPRTELTLFAGRGGRTDLFSTRGSFAITGVWSLIVPTLLAVLIVFNTMLGSLYERTREIAILTSIGLAPKHVGALFLAESLVHAVIGTVMGYLLGQAVTRVMHTYQLLPGLQLNYSSTATVLLSIFIIAVVVASSIYPSVQARRLAVPGLEVRWQLPEAVADVIQIELPFTVSEETALGVNAYLQEYFQAHTEAALGGFAAADVQLDCSGDPPKPNLRIAMTAWLSPYDVGVSQRVALETVLLPDGLFYGIHLRLERLSGDQGSWRRLNRHFTDLIRRQFLIWRILRPEARAAYRERIQSRLVSTG